MGRHEGGEDGVSAMMYVRFENARTDTISDTLGPYPFVQLTYEALRVAPEGEPTAYMLPTGEWTFQGLHYSDVVISTEEDRTCHTE